MVQKYASIVAKKCLPLETNEFFSNLILPKYCGGINSKRREGTHGDICSEVVS